MIIIQQFLPVSAYRGANGFSTEPGDTGERELRSLLSPVEDVLKGFITNCNIITNLIKNLLYYITSVRLSRSFKQNVKLVKRDRCHNVTHIF